MRDIDLKSLSLFVSVCDLGNIKDAASQEHIEPSAISKRMTQLEELLQVKLLIRGRRGAKPTPAGQALLEHARSILFTLDRVDVDMFAFQSGVKGHVRLAASASAIAESLLDDLTAFMRDPANEGIRIDIEEHFSNDIIGRVQNGMASLGVCWNRIEFGQLTCEPYRHDELVIAVPVGHALAAHAQLSFEQTLDFDHVGLTPSTAVSLMLQQAAAKAGRQVKFRIVVSNFDAAFRVVAAGLAVSIVPRQVAQQVASGGQVRLVRLSNSWAMRQFVICHRGHQELSPAAVHLLKYLSARASAQ